MLHRTIIASALLLSVFALGCGGSGSGGVASASTTAAVGSAPAAPRIVLQLGADVAPSAAARITSLVAVVDPRPVTSLAPQDPLPVLPPGSLVIAVGETTTTRALIDRVDVAPLGPEGFVLRSTVQAGVDLLATDGNDRGGHHAGGPNEGALFGAYALLEELGLAFLHPLAPTLPAGLRAPAAALDVRESPRWAERGIHLHTMHPLELTDLLNGWGPNGPQDDAGWRAQLPEWELVCEWLVANRQNTVEWIILGADSWSAFADGPVRQARLTELVARGHAWGLDVGADVPLALQQQHSWRMIRRTGSLVQETAQIDAAVDKLAACGFDLVATEVGFSEFTSPDDRRMLAWLDAFTERVAGRHKLKAFAKVHVSQGQTAPNFTDPMTGGPLNFNFLPHYADPRLGVMPHTVQHYALDDPAPTYGATDFDFIRRFLRHEAGSRPVLWHPETAYWVSFDIDVPLFLPLYADRRVHDARLIAQDEDQGLCGAGPHQGARIDGQMVFSSGWEWGYWLNDVVAARLAWDPQSSAPTHEAAVRAALRPLERALGAAGPDAIDALVRCMDEQRELLIEGRVAGGPRPRDIVRRNGQAYLQGWDTWDELPAMLGFIPRIGAGLTQPAKLGMLEMTSPVRITAGPDYAREVEPLLADMDRRFALHADALDALATRAPASALDLLDDMRDAARMTALRAKQVHGLYDYASGHAGRRPQAWRMARLAEARAALDAAQVVVARREQGYRVDPDRIAGWKDGPTAYRYRYLWTARTLFFWWRDEAKAVDRPWSPAFMNVIDPLDVAFGEGVWVPLAELARAAGQSVGAQGITDLLAGPAQEPTFPPAGLRSRP